MAINRIFRTALYAAVASVFLTLPVGWAVKDKEQTPVFILSQANAADEPKIDVPDWLEARYKRLYNSVRPANLEKHVKNIASHESRVAGYPGCDAAGEYVLQQFREIGLQDIEVDTFNVTAPIDEGSSLEVAGRKFSLYALWPNVVRTPHLPPEGLKCHLSYGGQGRLPDFDGQDVNGSATLVEFNSGSEWLNAPRLGAKAVIFIAPEKTMRGEAEAKFSAIPVDIPRFWISREDAELVKALIQNGGASNAVVKCSMPWRSRPAKNIKGVIPGTDPKLKDQVMIVHSHYDGMSVIPALAPSAEAACGISSLLELARTFKENPPRRTVWFVATSGHYLGLSGMRNYMETHMDEFRQPGHSDKIKAAMNRKWPAGQKRFPIYLTTLLALAIMLGITRSVNERVSGSTSRYSKALPVVALLLTIYLTVMVNFSLHRGFAFQIPDPPKIYLCTGLDLSSQTQAVGVFYKGYFYDMREDIQGRFSDIASRMREASERVGQVLDFDHKRRFNDGINPVAGKNWRNYIPGKMALDSEVFVLAGGRGVSFVSTEDARTATDTPFDTRDKINISNLHKQVSLIACLLDHMFRDTNDPNKITPYKMPLAEPANFSRLYLQGGAARLMGQVVMFDPTKSFVPDEPIPNSIAVVRSPHKSFMGVRANMVELTDEQGMYEFPGVAPLTAYGGTQRKVSVAAYNIDKNTGKIIYAPDQGAYGEMFPTEITMATGIKEMPILVFPCVATSIFDLIDPQGLRALSTIDIYDGDTDARPRQFGYVLAVPEFMNPHVEDMAVLFSMPGARLKAVMGAGPAATRFLLLNATEKHPEGTGYDVGTGGVISHTALTVATDMWTLDEFRIQRLRKYRIINDGLDKLHAAAAEQLKLANEALETNNYSVFDSHSRAAWGYEARAYPYVQKTAKDVVNGVIFYLFLMLPFAFFAERLFIGAVNLKWQIAGFFLIFIAIFTLFSKVHPAFDITMNPMIVLLAFIMLALSILVIMLITNKFEEQLKSFNRNVSGVHKADIGRMSVAAAAFSLGISNMRRRKARTVLTCITLVLLTFTVLSFTSIVSELKFRQVPAPRKDMEHQIYQGVMIRTPMWDPLQELSYRLLQDEFGKKYPVAVRAWFFGTTIGEQSFLTVSRDEEIYDAKAAVGLVPEEQEITHVHNALVAGRWFKDDDVHSIIIPTAIADKLNVRTQDIGNVEVTFAGQKYLVIGIVDNTKLKKILDLDGEPLTPVDFILMSKMSQQGKTSGEAGFREYTHLEPDNTFYVPYRTLLNMGGEVRSIAVGFASVEEVRQKLEELMPRLGLNLYAGVGDRIYRYSTMAGTSGAGFSTMFIPVLLAALIVLNTMLGSVYERVREIGIFSSIGLAPNHIAILFIAESMVYAVLGAVAGYILGQGATKLLTVTGWLPTLYLNFSSMSAFWATMVVVAVVIGSTLYPARKASEVATPAIERSWRVSEPEGDLWKIRLPFAVTGDQAVGVNGFLAEWFKAYEEYSIGDFVTQEVDTSNIEFEYGKGYQISSKVWVAPFDLGVSQQVVLQTIPTNMEDVYEVMVLITRESGDISNWKRVNRRFLNTLRKQFLIWRTMRHEERERYLEVEVASVEQREEVAKS